MFGTRIADNLYFVTKAGKPGENLLDQLRTFTGVSSSRRYTGMNSFPESMSNRRYAKRQAKAGANKDSFSHAITEICSVCTD